MYVYFMYMYMYAVLLLVVGTALAVVGTVLAVDTECLHIVFLCKVAMYSSTEESRTETCR